MPFPDASLYETGTAPESPQHQVLADGDGAGGAMPLNSQECVGFLITDADARPVEPASTSPGTEPVEPQGVESVVSALPGSGCVARSDSGQHDPLAGGSVPDHPISREGREGIPHSTSLYHFPRAVQDRARALSAVMAILDRDGCIQSVLERVSREVHIAPLTLRKRYAKWLASGRDPLSQIDRRPYPDLWTADRQATLPREFVLWAKGQLLGNQRKSKPAWRGIINRLNRWRRGDRQAAIPGYDEPPPDFNGHRHPLGWSYSNLLARCELTKAEKALARVGTSAALTHLPYVPGTRAGARWLEWLFFDDVVLDLKILCEGQAVRILQFGGMDLASGIYLGFGQRPDLARPDGVRERLKRRDFLVFVAAIISRYGYPADYPMHLVLERGTATLSAAEARVLFDLSDGLIRCGYTAMTGQFVCGWEEQRSGNSSGKAMLESYHNLLHNELASLPGQVGKDRDHCPKILPGQEQQAIALWRAGQVMSPEQRAAMKLPLLDKHQAYELVWDAVARTNARRDHQCEGFDSIGLWRIKGSEMDWQPDSLLAGLNTPIPGEHLEWSSRVETPDERARRLSAGVKMVHLDPAVWTRFYEDSHALTKVTDQAWIEIKDDGRKLLFGPDRPEQALPAGTEVLAYHAPHDPTHALITVNGRFHAAWPRIHPVRRGDQQALGHALARKARFLRETTKDVESAMAERITATEDAAAQNLGILANLDSSHRSYPCPPEFAAMSQADRALARAPEAKRNLAREGAARDAALAANLPIDHDM